MTHSESEQQGFEAGLKAASQYLLETATDFKEIIQRPPYAWRQITRLSPADRINLKVFLEKIALLEGQAQHILEIKNSKRRS